MVRLLKLLRRFEMLGLGQLTDESGAVCLLDIQHGDIFLAAIS